MMWRSYRTREYVNITRCYKCHGYGHIAKVCNSPDQLCSVCGSKEHLRADCPKKNDDNSPKCALSAGNHTANYKGCEIYKTLKIQRFPKVFLKSLDLALSLVATLMKSTLIGVLELPIRKVNTLCLPYRIIDVVI